MRMTIKDCEKVNQLIKEYKEKREEKILNQVFEILLPLIKDKAKYVYSHWFNINGINVNLRVQKLMEVDDIIQELNLLIIELVGRIDINLPFTNYLFSSLENWTPNCMRSEEFLARIKTFPSTAISKEGGDYIDSIDDLNTKSPNFDGTFEELTDKENEITKIMFENPGITQEEIAQKLKISQQRISFLLSKIRKKIKTFK